MGVQAEWSGNVFSVEPGNVRSLGSISASRSVSVERNEDKEGEPATQTVAFDLMTLSVSYPVIRSACGEDPRSVYGAWWRLVGTYAPFYLGGRAFMADKFLLKKADMSDIETDSSGNVLMCTIALDFEEYAEDASGLKADKGASTGLRPGIFEQTGGSAVGVGPSDAQKRGKMPSNPGM